MIVDHICKPLDKIFAKFPQNTQNGFSRKWFSASFAIISRVFTGLFFFFGILLSIGKIDFILI